jgi:hypothetical protein
MAEQPGIPAASAPSRWRRRPRAIEAHACYRLRLAEWAREQGLSIVDAMRAVDAERARSGSAP